MKPEIIEEHIVEIVEGRHLQVEDILHSKKKEYCPISIALKDGVTCITGANMEEIVKRGWQKKAKIEDR